MGWWCKPCSEGALGFVLFTGQALSAWGVADQMQPHQPHTGPAAVRLQRQHVKSI